MSVRYVDIGVWSIAVESEVMGVHEGLALNFGRRYSANPPAPSQQRLRCEVVDAPELYRALEETVASNGPRIEAGKGVLIHYGFLGSKTWLNVTKTAIIELDDAKPAECRVVLYPDASFGPGRPDRPEPGELAACPEAFFYPMLVEWIRNFGACLVHCGAVALDGRALFLNGAPGSGKSTHVLRLICRGASFVADDLAFLHAQPDGLWLRRFREVANVNTRTLDLFPELAHLKDAPMRGDGKYCISIPERFPQVPITDASPGIILRLHPGETPTLRPVPPDELLDRMHSMAWFSSRPAANQAHFDLLSDWLCRCPQWYVSRAYLRDRLDDLVSRLREGRDLEGTA